MSDKADRDKGKSVGTYTLECRLGEGGMGELWLAQHPTLERPTVLKKLRRELAALPDLSERFEREARAAASVHHPNVVMVYDAFQWRSELYIAQEYVDGVNLRAALERCDRLPPRIAAAVALEVTRGLEAVHAKGMVHRDLKPANVMLGRGGEVKIVDFGIALESSAPSLTRAGVVLGTPEYMAPEQLLGDRVDARADLFALGSMLYETLRGAPPYPSPTSEESEQRLTRMRRERYLPLRKQRRDIPRVLARATRDCLRPKAAQRPASASELRARLERAVTNASAEAIRAELAAWLWERDIFERRANETVVRVAVPMAVNAPSVRRSFWVAAAVTAACLAAGVAAASAGVISFSDLPALLPPQLLGP